MSYNKNDIYYNSNKINTKLEHLNQVINTLKDNNLDQYIKYNINNKKGGASGTNNQIDVDIDNVGIVELYNKLYNIYIIYRFRFNNSANLNISFINLSDIIKTFKTTMKTKDEYDIKYIKSLDKCTETIIKFKKDSDNTYSINNNINNEESYTYNNILFTFRQITTHIIKDMLLTDLKNQDVMENIIKALYIFKIIKYSLAKNENEFYTNLSENKIDINVLITMAQTINDVEIDEIIEKSKMIQNLVAAGKSNSDKTYENKDEVTYIRGATNHLIQLIGDEYDQRNETDSLPISSTNTSVELFINCINKLKILMKKKESNNIV